MCTLLWAIPIFFVVFLALATPNREWTVHIFCKSQAKVAQTLLCFQPYGTESPQVQKQQNIWIGKASKVQLVLGNLFLKQNRSCYLKFGYYKIWGIFITIYVIKHHECMFNSVQRKMYLYHSTWSWSLQGTDLKREKPTSLLISWCNRSISLLHPLST